MPSFLTAAIIATSVSILSANSGAAQQQPTTGNPVGGPCRLIQSRSRVRIYEYYRSIFQTRPSLPHIQVAIDDIAKVRPDVSG